MNNNLKQLRALETFTQVPCALIITAILIFSSGFIMAEGTDTEGDVSLNAFAGQTVRILIEAADAGRGSLVEAGIDDVKIIKE